MNTILLQAQAQQGGSGMSMIIMLVVLFVIMYFFMIRPQNKSKRKFKSSAIRSLSDKKSLPLVAYMALYVTLTK